MKHRLLLTALAGLACLPAARAVNVIPTDTLSLFSYTDTVGRGGLRFAWRTEGRPWVSLGGGMEFVQSDFGPWWGKGKQMRQPELTRDASGLWRLAFRTGTDGSVEGTTSSRDLIVWKPQDYTHADPDRKPTTETISLGGKQIEGQVHRVPRELVVNLERYAEQQRYRQMLHSQQAKEDPVRFAGLQPVKASLKTSPQGAYPISDKLYGIFFEDINQGADGGLYAELIENRDFEYGPADHMDWDALYSWRLQPGKGSALTIATANPLHPNNLHYAVVESGKQKGATIANDGFDAIPVKKGSNYLFSLFSRHLKGAQGPARVMLTTPEGTVLAEAEVNLGGQDWTQSEANMKVEADCAAAVLRIGFPAGSSYAIDMVSLFPEATFHGRRNGLRADPAQTLADLHPKFVRFPGGCVAHGQGLDNVYDWKGSIGPLHERKPLANLWGYHQTRGLGYYEYFQFCEDIGAEPLPVLAAGVPCQNSFWKSAHSVDALTTEGQQCGVPLERMDSVVQDFLDLIEWANGDPATSEWARLRAEAGHPEPFNLKYIGVGNEDLISDVFKERFKIIHDALRKAHPEITVIGTVGPFYEGSDYEEGWRFAGQEGVEMVDEHYYVEPGWLIHNQDYYDQYDRKGPKVYLGEYAAHLPGRPNNIETALAEALYMLSAERNGDVVAMTSYAPLLAKMGHRQWNPDLIYFTPTEVMPTPGYHAQRMLSTGSGNLLIPSELAVESGNDDVHKRVAASVVKDTKTGRTILKMVNLLPMSTSLATDLPGGKAVITRLQGAPDSESAKPEVASTAIPAQHTFELPPYSFTTVTFEAPSPIRDEDLEGYLFVYFTGNDKAEEQIHYAIANNSLNFKALNGNRPVIASDSISSTGGVRDPHILRSPDGGEFLMVATDMVSDLGWDSNRAMVLMKSRDLLNWSHNVVNLEAWRPGLKRVWAPQTIFDPEAGKYMIYWSMKHDDGPDIIYYAYANDDFTGLATEPAPLFMPENGKSCIDGDIVYHDGLWHLFYKTEGHGNGIRVATTPSLTSGDWKEYSDYKQLTDKAVEGSSIFKVNGEDRYVLMYDVYMNGAYEFAETPDLQNFKLTEVSLDFHPRHGTVLPLTGSEMRRLENAFGIDSIQAYNPILPDWHADPEILFDPDTQRYYIYSTTDGVPGWGGHTISCFSSKDLKNWRPEGDMLDVKSKQVAWADGNAWAPAAERFVIDGKPKYYLFFSANAKGGDEKQIGVAISDSPTGPFRDSGAPIIAKNPSKGWGQQIDVDIFTDPKTGQAYIYWGNCYMAGATFDPATLEVGEPVVLTPEGGTLADYEFREAPYVFFRDGRYYFLWSVDDTGSPNYHVAYGTSDSPLGPIEVAESPVVLIQRPKRGVYGPAHCSVIKLPGDEEAWRIVYHRINGDYLDNGPGWHRQVCIDPMYFDSEGRIIPVEPAP